MGLGHKVNGSAHLLRLEEQVSEMDLEGVEEITKSVLDKFVMPIRQLSSEEE